MYRFCDVDYIDFWDFTPAETDGMLRRAQDKIDARVQERANLLMWIANAPHVQKSNKQPWELKDFLPESQKQLRNEEEIFNEWWNAAN